MSERERFSSKKSLSDDQILALAERDTDNDADTTDMELHLPSSQEESGDEGYRQRSNCDSVVDGDGDVDMPSDTERDRAGGDDCDRGEYNDEGGNGMHHGELDDDDDHHRTNTQGRALGLGDDTDVDHESSGDALRHTSISDETVVEESTQVNVNKRGFNADVERKSDRDIFARPAVDTRERREPPLNKRGRRTNDDAELDCDDALRAGSRRLAAERFRTVGPEFVWVVVVFRDFDGSIAIEAQERGDLLVDHHDTEKILCWRWCDKQRGMFGTELLKEPTPSDFQQSKLNLPMLAYLPLFGCCFVFSSL